MAPNFIDFCVCGPRNTFQYIFIFLSHLGAPGVGEYGVEEKDDRLGLPQWSLRLVWVRVVCWLTVELCAALHGWRSREAKAVLHGKIGQNVGGK